MRPCKHHASVLIATGGAFGTVSGIARFAARQTGLQYATPFRRTPEVKPAVVQDPDYAKQMVERFKQQEKLLSQDPNAQIEKPKEWVYKPTVPQENKE